MWAICHTVSQSQVCVDIFSLFTFTKISILARFILFTQWNSSKQHKYEFRHITWLWSGSFIHNALESTRLEAHLTLPHLDHSYTWDGSRTLLSHTIPAGRTYSKDHQPASFWNCGFITKVKRNRYFIFAQESKSYVFKRKYLKMNISIYYNWRT